MIASDSDASGAANNGDPNGAAESDDYDDYSGPTDEQEDEHVGQRDQWKALPSSGLAAKLCRATRDSYLDFETYSLNSCAVCYK